MRKRIIHFCTDSAPASGVNTFCTELDRALRVRGVDSRIVRSYDALAAFDDASDRSRILHIHGLWPRAHHRAAVWARRNGIPIVWSTHGMTAPWAMRHKRLKKLLAWFLYQRHDLRSAALVHCTAEQEVAWNARFGLKKTCVVPLGTHPPAAEPMPAAGGRTNRRVLLFVGRIYPVKALDNLITAFARACGPRPGDSAWRLRLVGPDEAGHLADLVSLAGCLGVPVEFVGPRFGADLAAEYAACDALALVSHTENFGATVADALAYGKPVVTSTNTPWREVGGRCGWWVDNSPETLSAALRELMSLSDGERAEMGRKGRALIEEKYTWPAVAAKMEECYVLCQ